MRLFSGRWPIEEPLALLHVFCRRLSSQSLLLCKTFPRLGKEKQVFSALALLKRRTITDRDIWLRLGIIIKFILPSACTNVATAMLLHLCLKSTRHKFKNHLNLIIRGHLFPMREVLGHRPRPFPSAVQRKHVFAALAPRERGRSLFFVWRTSYSRASSKAGVRPSRESHRISG